MGLKSGSAKSAEKVLDTIKGMKDFDHIQRKKQTKVGDKQQPKEWKKEYRVENCKCCGATHMQRLCPAFGKHAMCAVSRTMSEQYARGEGPRCNKISTFRAQKNA